MENVYELYENIPFMMIHLNWIWNQLKTHLWADLWGYFSEGLTREGGPSCRVGSIFGLQPSYREVTGKTRVLCLPAFAPCWWMHLLLLLLPSFTASEPHTFDLLTWIKDQKLSRNPPGFQCQMGTAETSSLLDCSATGFSTRMMYLHLKYSIISRCSNTIYVTCK